jgi:hypothetical protein
VRQGFSARTGCLDDSGEEDAKVGGGAGSTAAAEEVALGGDPNDMAWRSVNEAQSTAREEEGSDSAGITLRKLETIDDMGEGGGTAAAASSFCEAIEDCRREHTSVRNSRVHPASPGKEKSGHGAVLLLLRRRLLLLLLIAAAATHLLLQPLPAPALIPPAPVGRVTASV